MEYAFDWLKKWATYSPNNIALQDAETGRSLSYLECYELSERIAQSLKNEYQVKAGDRVAILALNHIEYVVLFFAIRKIGAIMVPLNFRLTAHELDYMFGDCTPSLLLYEDSFSATISKSEKAPAKKIQLDGPDGFLEKVKSSPEKITGSEDNSDEDATCMILYTSGTTGHPKGAMITNKMLFWNSVNTGLRLNLTQNDVTLTFAPFFHTGGWNVLTTPFIHRGARLVLLRKFDADSILRLCDQENVSILFGVPTMMDMLAQSPEFKNCSLESVRYAIVGGEPMPLPLIKTWHDKGVPIRQGYGLTEFGPNVFSLNEEHATSKIGSIGFPNFYIDAAVADDNGNLLGDNEAGELILRGPVCMKGYWNNPEATSETIRNGWLHTGDIVKRDSEGFFYVVDRKKDMFISGAENVYPAEVEHVLREHPHIREAAVIGVPHPKWGETGKAFVVAAESGNLTGQDVKEWCLDRLAKYKVPGHVKFISELPKSDSGKVLKRQLKEDEAP